MGFNALAITEEEEELLPMGANETYYVQVSTAIFVWRYIEAVSRISAAP